MRQLRFALLCDEMRLEQWHLQCLDELDSSAELVAVVGSSPGNGSARRSSGLLAAYTRRVERFFAAEGVGARFASLPRELGSADVDFVLKLGPVAVAPELHEVARFGVWGFRHEVEGSGLPFFDEVDRGAHVTSVSLLAHDENGTVRVLEHGTFRTETRSYLRSRSRIQSAIAAWPARACRRAAVQGALDFGDPAPAQSPPPKPRRVRLLAHAARAGIRRAEVAWSRLFRHPQWNVGVLRRPVDTLLSTGSFADEDVEWFPLEGRRGFLADPFAFVRGDRIHVLCEFFDYRDSRGSILALEHTESGFVAGTDEPLPLPFHTSYPYVLDLPDGVYCVPETAAAGEVVLYRRAGSGRWERVCALLPNVAGVDATVFRHEGRWWLLCARQGSQEDAELWAWHSDALQGPWAEHALNPVKTDVRGARPGGTPFVHDGVLYRPAQDCSATYGGRIVVHRVTRLTPSEFAEEPVAVVEASPASRFPIGPHTLTPVGEVVLVDGRRTVFVPSALRAFLLILLRSAGRRRRRD